jgi:hypothetical protein
MREKLKRFKVRRALRNLLWVSALCCVLANAGCGNVTPFLTPSPATPRIDWGMSLLGGTSAGIGQYPAKFSFDVNAPPDCSNDFVVFNSNHNGSAATVANVVAFNQLYSTQGSAGGLCAQDGPSVYWSYFTGTGVAQTSVALSLDGSKVAFVENNSAATLRILKWKAGEGSGAASPAAVDQDISGSSWSACNAGNSCIASIQFSTNTGDPRSAPYVDYANDVIYVGDIFGVLHKFTGVFNGTPAEVSTGWPITVNSGKTLTSPVYDSVSGNIFVGDSSGRLSYVREANSTAGSCSVGSPPCLGATTQQVGAAGSIVDGPIVDSTSGFVFAVNGTDTLHHGTILQANTALTSAVQFSIGGTISTGSLYNGAFDQTYLNSAAGSVAGFMYVCGKDPANTNRPAIYQLSFTSAGVLNSVGTPLLMNSTNSTSCSPVTEINNTGSSSASGDWIFFSIGNFAANASPIPTTSNCRTGVNASTGGRGCLIGINVTNAANPAINSGGTWPPATTYFTAQGTNNNANATALFPFANGAAGGIIVDNVSTGSQTSNIYFMTVSSSTVGPGLPSCNTTSGLQCAVKLTQSNLN